MKQPKTYQREGFTKFVGDRIHRIVKPSGSPPLPKPRNVGRGFTGFGTRDK
jgi:hypothetical protein